MSFSSLGLSAGLLDAVAEQGYETPSPIQQQAIPAVLSGADVLAAAQTGTGKTAGFTLPLLERLAGGRRAAARGVRALVLTPTRELAAQVSDSVHTYGKYQPLKSAVVFGGVGINPQIDRLRGGVDILVATPGRLLDLAGQKAVQFEQLEVLVLDEADRMLDMGFIHDIRRIVKLLPAQRQNLMFSATFSREIRELAKTIVSNPVEIAVTPPNSTVESVAQRVHPVAQGHKAALLVHLIKTQDWYQVLVFTRTKHGANRLARQLEGQGIGAAAIHGNKSQNARTRALADFKDGAVQVLVATDIAARGLDIDQLPYVVNFDLPNVPEDYVHRIGRTGRAGATGEAISLLAPDEAKLLADIERLIRLRVPRVAVPDFDPPAALPEAPAATTSSPAARTQGARSPQSRQQRGQRPASPARSGSRTGAAAGDAAGQGRRRRRRRPARAGASGSMN